MKVLKFGGSSVGTTNGIRNVKQIVSSQKGQVIVVVSALGGVTDQLIKTAQMASEGNKAYEDELTQLTNRHYDLIIENIPTDNKRNELQIKVEQLLGELRDIFQGIYLIKGSKQENQRHDTELWRTPLQSDCSRSDRSRMERLTRIYQDRAQARQTCAQRRID